MAANDVGLAPLAALADGTRKGAVDVPSDEDAPVAPDQFDERYETTRHEIWAYYWYVIVDSQVLASQRLYNEADMMILQLLCWRQRADPLQLCTNGISKSNVPSCG